MEVTAANATRTYPACAMELYPSSLFMLVCASAPRLPENIVSAASTQKAQNQYFVAAGPLAKIRSSSANAAASGPAEKRAVTGLGAPSQTDADRPRHGAADPL